jgi:ribosome-binding protein aMBF1 (putative translation factor)
MIDPEETAECGMCGADPVAHERVPIGVTEVDMCEECYEAFVTRRVGDHGGVK